MSDRVIKAEIEKRTVPVNIPTGEKNDKTMVIFSGDIDKTIAAFIIANGAAATMLPYRLRMMM